MDASEKGEMRYVVATAARNEAQNLPRLACSLRSQAVLPTKWLIIENGSTDDTRAVAQALADETPWITLISVESVGERDRGAPIVRALETAIDVASAFAPEFFVNIDADVSFAEDYLSRLLGQFAISDRLGIAGGSCWEVRDGRWERRFVTGGTVWGATRAYRWECLRDVLPLERRLGWDGIDQIRAQARGWATRTFDDLPFFHHRPEGSADGSSWEHWRQNGDTAYFMGYRPSYLALRTLFQARSDVRAFGLLAGFAASWWRRSVRLDDPGARAILREGQRWRNLRARKGEAQGHDRRPV